MKADIIPDDLGAGRGIEIILAHQLDVLRMVDLAAILDHVVGPLGEVDPAAPSIRSLTKEKL